jgi:isoleucyl-tRNA synthetase
VVRHETYDHNYPHCWRTDTPIIYKAVSSWYVRRSPTSRTVWSSQPGDQLDPRPRQGRPVRQVAGGNARDWSISRNRFWGAADPGVESDDPTYPRTDVYGSLDEIERRLRRAARPTCTDPSSTS